MRWFGTALLGAALLAAGPAAAAACKSRGAAETSIVFPKGDRDDLPFARSVVPAVLPVTTAGLPARPSCTRMTLTTALGDYRLGGEDGEAFPRIAVRADGKPGPVAYVAESPLARGFFALAVIAPGQPTSLKRVYNGVPTDRRLAEDVRDALGGGGEILNFDPAIRLVRYAFTPVDGTQPLPVHPDKAGGFSADGPQVLVLPTGDIGLLEMENGIRHKPSGFSCPQTFPGLPVLLMTVEPKADYLSCRYRAGTEFSYTGLDRMRYRLTLTRGAGQTPQSVFDELTQGARMNMIVKGDHPPPLATGPAPAPQLVNYWDTESDGETLVQGLWVAQAGGGWIAEVRAQYAPAPGSDAEAGKVARALFDAVAKEVR